MQQKGTSRYRVNTYVFAYITQGKIDHMVSIINPKVNRLKDDTGKKDNKLNSKFISTLKQDSEILTKWHSIDGKAPVKISLIKLVDNNKSCCSRSDSCR